LPKVNHSILQSIPVAVASDLTLLSANLKPYAIFINNANPFITMSCGVTVTCVFSLFLVALPWASQGFSVSTIHTTFLSRTQRAVAAATRRPNDAAFLSRRTNTFTLLGTTTGASHGVFDLPEDGMIPHNSKGNGGATSSSSSSSSTGIGSSVTGHAEPTKSRYLQGDELQQLRQRVYSMRQSLQEARESGRTLSVQTLSRSILAAQQLDGEFMYQVSLERMEAAAQAGLVDEAQGYRRAATEARASLPQFQLEGLWVGKYGDTFQMINVSYTGDVLVAHKVTGDRHVPKGEVTFTVDLSPNTYQSQLEPIELSSDAVEQWGSRYLQRHAGQGQVAADGFVNAKWLDGQLILVNQYFSFAWLPTGHQVFFGRPSAELTLKMLRNTSGSSAWNERFHVLSANSEVSNPRHYLARCWEETELLDDEMEVSDGIFRSHDQHYYFDQDGCFE
jgi:Cyclin D1 binding domain